VTNALTSLRASLEEAVDMIDESLLLPADVAISLDNSALHKTQLNFSDTTSLLDKCDKFEAQYRDSKPVIRIIHHLACSGGTLITKCISSMANTFVLSEMHPTTPLNSGDLKARFTPTDFIVQAQFGKFPEQETLAKNVFIASIETIEKHVRQTGAVLVLRDHTHSDYCIGKDIANSPAIKSILQEKFRIKSLLTIRDPIDAYLSLVKKDWVHFSPANFDEYCRRFIKMLSHYPEAKICKYEDFVDDPIWFMQDICEYWELPFSDYFTSIFGIANVSGDSGRKSETIQKMERRPISNDLQKEIESSENYKTISKLFNYGLLV
jgi:hypothetical protein